MYVLYVRRSETDRTLGECLVCTLQSGGDVVVDHDRLVCWARAEPETPARDESVFYFSYLHFVSFTGKESPPHRATERRALESERAHT